VLFLQANLIKESIRLSHNDLGDFFYERGDLQVGGCTAAKVCALQIPAFLQT
jgi:hypothetical protein